MQDKWEPETHSIATSGRPSRPISRSWLHKFNHEAHVWCILHNADALPWKKINLQFSAFRILFSWVVCGWLSKEPFLVLWWRCRHSYCKMLEVTTIIGSHAGSQALTQHRIIILSKLSAAAFLPVPSAMSNQRIIGEKETFYLVCVFNDVILLLRRCS